MRNLRQATRLLLKNPVFSLVAIATLALGIGANTAVFGVMDRLLRRPLPVREPQQLALLGQSFQNGGFDFDFNYPLFKDYQRESASFAQLSATAEQAVGLGVDGQTERQRALLVSGNYFSMLGLDAALGRVFAEHEGVEIGDASVAILSHGLWQRRFGADPAVLGRKVTVNGQPFTIIGVAPRHFAGTTRGTTPDLYLPITSYGELTSDWPGGQHPLSTRYFTWHQMLGRLKPGVTHSQAQAEMTALAQRIAAVSPANTSTNLAVLEGSQGFTDRVRESRQPLTLLMVTSCLVLLITCANLANLQLARAGARARDFAVRLALGAGRGRVMRELLTESVLLAGLGGAAGVAVAVFLGDFLQHFQGGGSEAGPGMNVDFRLLGFALAASVATGLVFGLVPAWRASRTDLVPELKGQRAVGIGRKWDLRHGLVVVQVALSLLVLASAGLCLRSLGKLQQLDPGFTPSMVVLLSFDLGLNNYKEANGREFYRQLLERARTLPGVESAGLAWGTPLSGRMPGMSINRVEGYDSNTREGLSADINFISAAYFKTLGVPILRGREFNENDKEATAPVVIVDQEFVRRFLGEQDPIGRRIYLPGPDANQPLEIVGVVQGTRNRRLTEAPRKTMYFPVLQRPALDLTLAVRTGVAPAATITALREAAKSLAPNVPVFNIRTLEQQRAGSLNLQRMAATLLAAFGLLALLLASLGIYGLLAYSVSRRTREIGVRMALGANMGNVLSLVARQGLALVVAGMVLGLAGAAASTRLLKGFLYQVEPLDPPTFALVAVILLVVSWVACWLPARRAARIEPMEALRCE